jgi:hypothetical protein
MTNEQLIPLHPPLCPPHEPDAENRSSSNSGGTLMLNNCTISGNIVGEDAHVEFTDLDPAPIVRPSGYSWAFLRPIVP